MMNAAQIIKLQESGIDYYGEPLTVDGLWGPKTAWWAGICSLPWEQQEIVCRMLKYYKEKKGEDPGRPNRSDWVDMILKPAGIGLGHPWCVALTSYVIRDYVDSWRYHTSTLKLIEWAYKNGRIVKEPQPGYLVTLMYNSTEGHTEVNLAHNQDWVLDVGGNLGNGMKVGKRARAGLTFIRTIDPVVPLACPPLDNMLNLDGTGTR